MNGRLNMYLGFQNGALASSRTFVALFCVIAASLANVANAATPFLPIGIYSVPDTADFQEIRAAGFNVVAGRAEKNYLDAAQAAGLKVLAAVPSLKSPGPQRMTVLDRHRALWAWYLADEPDLNMVPPVDIGAGYRGLKQLGLRKPVALTLFQGYEAANYADYCDILMVDRYPVSWLPLANFGQHMRMARLALGKQKPFVAIIQAFDWTAYPGLLRATVPLRPPTSAELRCMTYEALARGANGIFFYEFDGAWKIRDHPQVWSALKQVVREVNDRTPLFQAEPIWWAKDHDYSDADTAFNGALESSVTSTLLRVRKGNSQMTAGSYILAVNNTPKPLAYSFLLPPPQGSRKQVAPCPDIPVFGESRQLEVLRNRVSDHFEAFEVHVYGPLRQ